MDILKNIKIIDFALLIDSTLIIKMFISDMKKR